MKMDWPLSPPIYSFNIALIVITGYFEITLDVSFDWNTLVSELS